MGSEVDAVSHCNLSTYCAPALQLSIIACNATAHGAFCETALWLGSKAVSGVDIAVAILEERRVGNLVTRVCQRSPE